MSKEDFTELIFASASMFSSNDSKEYEQVKGLAMWSPLSAVPAYLYMEAMEEDHYKSIVWDSCTYKVEMRWWRPVFYSKWNGFRFALPYTGTEQYWRVYTVY